jgi:DNA polymerase-1
MKKLIIFDGNALLHRAYHAIKPLTAPNGQIVNAVYGFVRVFLKTMKDLSPDYVAVAWDRREPTFRHEAYKAYKAQREKKPQELYDQIDIIKQFLSVYGVPSYNLKGFEADDIIATIAVKTDIDQVIIMTGDKDTLQIVDERINVLSFKKGVSETLLYTPAEIKKEFGLLPVQIIDLKALAGDPSDNIKGVRGIGKLGAEKLLQQYKDIDEIYKNLDKLQATEKVKATLRSGKNDAYQSRELVVLRKDVPINFSLEEMKFGNYDQEKANKFFISYGFRSLLEPVSGAVQPAGKIRELASLNDMKDAVKKIENSGEFIFHITEGEEGLFGKEIKELGLAFDGQMTKVVFGKIKAKDVFAELKSVFENEAIKKTGYDLKLQMYSLNGFGIDFRGGYFDIMIAAYLLRAGDRRYELTELIIDYLKKQPEQNLVADLAMLKIMFAKKLEEEKLTRVFYEIEMPLLGVLYGMEKNGIKVDKAGLAKLSSDFEARLKTIDAEIWKLAGEEFNIDSPQQLKVILYDKLELKPASGRIKKGKTGLSTAASELEKLSGSHPIVDLISEHRELAKLKNTYIDTLPKMLDRNDRVHSTFNQTVASTGRLSSSSPNLQNIPIRTELGKKIREAFIADKGTVLVSLDYSQIELRLAAALSGERHMIDAFNKGTDIHRETAAEIFGVPESEVTKEMRGRAKSINFGVLYGMGVNGLAAATKMTRDEAEGFLERYYSTHPAIMEYVDRTKALAYKTGFVETIFGRRRYLPEINSGIPQLQAAAERMAINMPIQGTAADVIKMAMIEIEKNICNADVKMVLQVHDELVFEIKKSVAEKATADIKEVMENICKLSVPLLVESETGERWE